MSSHKMSCFCQKALFLFLLVMLSMQLPGPVVVHADRAKGDAYFQVRIRYMSGKTAVSRVNSVSLEGDGHFNVRTARTSFVTRPGYYEIHTYVFSDMPFKVSAFSYVQENTTGGDTQVYKGSLPIPEVEEKEFNNGLACYYVEINHGTWGSQDCSNFSLSAPNVINFVEEPDVDAIAATVDLTRDDYLDDGEKAAVYNRDLDFLTLKGDYKVKYTIEKDGNGKWNFITPDEAGILLEWTNRKDIDGAYVKVTAYGEFYEGFWASTYTNTGITVSDIRRNDLSHLLRQKDMVSLAQSSLGKPSGFGFVVKYMYIQSFGTIDGQFCRGRIYKLDSDLVTDYGNADSEYDEYFPEITGGDSMPPEYEPDPGDPDPEKTEPDPDPDDDTTIITPVPKPDEPVFDSDLDLLKAVSVFFDGLKSSMVLLGDFPAFIANIFGFLPSPVISLIGLSIAAVIVLRFIGR